MILIESLELTFRTLVFKNHLLLELFFFKFVFKFQHYKTLLIIKHFYTNYDSYQLSLGQCAEFLHLYDI